MGAGDCEWEMMHECEHVCVHVWCVCLQYMWWHMHVCGSGGCCSVDGVGSVQCVAVLVVYVCSMWVECDGGDSVCVQCMWWWCVVAMCVCVCAVCVWRWCACVCSEWCVVVLVVYVCTVQGGCREVVCDGDV